MLRLALAIPLLLGFMAPAQATAAPMSVAYTGTGANRSYVVVGTPGNDAVLATTNASSKTYSFAAPQGISESASVCTVNGAGTVVTCTADAVLVVLDGMKGNDQLRYQPAVGLAPPTSIGGGEGDDVLVGGAAGDLLDAGDGQDVLVGGAGLDSMSCGDGTDLVSYDDGRTTGVTVDLNTTDQAVSADSDQIGSTCEGVIGSSKADTIVGDSGNNALFGDADSDALSGAAGNDVITPGRGSDTVDGGPNIDTVSYDDGRTDGLVVDLAAGTGGDTETVAGFENLTGSAGDDSLAGTSGQNALIGLGGDDILIGRGGADAIDGIGPRTDPDAPAAADGTDTLDCSDHADGVTISLDPSSDLGCDPGEGVVDVDNAIGGAGADTITGTDGANFLSGMAGNDTITAAKGDDTVAGGVGQDTMEGSEGADVLSYDDGRMNGTSVDLSAAPAVGADAGDQAAGFENVTGSANADMLAGDERANALDGGGGDDVITGGAGADTLVGGGGIDTLSYNDGRKTGVTVSLGSTAGGDAGETIAGFENVVGTSAADVLTGSAGPNVISALAGSDKIQARDSVADTIDCGADADSLTADPIDTTKDCESVDAPPAPPPGTGGAGPSATPTSPTGTTPGMTSRCVVPKLRNRKLSQARTRLKKAGCKVGKVTRPKRKRRRGYKLVVRRTTPKAKAEVQAGTKVALRLGFVKRNRR